MSERLRAGRAGTTPNPTGIAIVDRRLLIEGEPFLVLGGELHNSSSSTPIDLAARWSRLTALHLNTALAAVSWELVEPEEGVFDFSTVDALIDGAREHGLKLIPLWFGSWKNGLSSYRPAWVKRDPARFPLVEGSDGVRLHVLSAFSDASRDADAKAFAALMAHIRDRDADQKTVIMVQVENEVGILGASRDHGESALAVWNTSVDPSVVDAFGDPSRERKSPIDSALGRYSPGATWPEAFGEIEETDELFQAVAYARYVDRVIEAGRAEYELPYFVNTWLDSEVIPPGGSVFAGASGGQRPGVYPSGGPLPHVAAAWLAAAPNLTMLTPDIYRGDFDDWCRRYADPNVALFVPEMKKDRDGVGSLHVAIGSHGAIGTSPFGIDGVEEEDPPENRELLAGAYAALASISPQILAAQSRGDIVGFHLTDEKPEFEAELGGYRLRIRRDLEERGVPGIESGWGIVLTDSDGGFVGTGTGFAVTFEVGSTGDASRTVALERVEAGAFVGGEWRTDQVLNGDETVSGEVWRFPYFRPVVGATFGEAFPVPRILRAHLYEY